MSAIMYSTDKPITHHTPELRVLTMLIKSSLSNEYLHAAFELRIELNLGGPIGGRSLDSLRYEKHERFDVNLRQCHLG